VVGPQAQKRAASHLCSRHSLSQKFAEKIHAYTLPRDQGYNSRVKDLIAMALLIRSYEMNDERVAAALKQTFARRGTHKLPDTLHHPLQEWKSTFEALAKQCDLEGDIKIVFARVCGFYEGALLTKNS
jgi:hypothetical protein